MGKVKKTPRNSTEIMFWSYSTNSLAGEMRNMLKPEDIPIFIENIENVKPVSMCNGITRRTLSTGQKLMFCLFEWETGAILPEHSHHHEQVGYVISGKVEFTIGGRTIILGPGESYAIPSNVVHSGKSYEPTRVLDAFSPIREEYL